MKMIKEILHQLSQDKKISILKGLTTGLITKEDLKNPRVLDILTLPKPLQFTEDEWGRPETVYTFNCKEVTKEEYDYILSVCKLLLNFDQFFILRMPWRQEN